MDRKYRIDYLRTHDIDCFFKIKNIAFHFASNGCTVPSEIKRNRNKTLQEIVSSLDSQYPVICNKDIVRSYLLGYNSNETITEEMVNNYISTFKQMARKGFISMDCIREGCEEQETVTYYVIAYPNDIKEKKLPSEIMDIIPILKTNIKIGNLDEVLSKSYRESL